MMAPLGECSRPESATGDRTGAMFVYYAESEWLGQTAMFIKCTAPGCNNSIINNVDIAITFSINVIG